MTNVQTSSWSRTVSWQLDVLATCLSLGSRQHTELGDDLPDYLEVQHPSWSSSAASAMSDACPITPYGFATLVLRTLESLTLAISCNMRAGSTIQALASSSSDPFETLLEYNAFVEPSAHA